MSLINRNTPPATQLPEILEIENPIFLKTKGGVPVHIFPSSTEPIVKVDFIFEAGTKFQDSLFTSGCTSSLLLEGTKTSSGSEIAERIDYLGSYIYPFYDRDEAGISTICLKKHLNENLQLVMDVLINPIFPENEIDIFKAKKEQAIILDEQRTESVARKKFLEGLLGKTHPYGVHGQLKDLELLSSEELKGFHKKYYHPDNLTVILTCDNDPELISILEKSLDQWNPVASFTKKDINLQDPERQENFENYYGLPHTTQASIRLGKIVPGPGHPDFNKITILNVLLGGYFGSRLMQNIREEKGLTYGIGSGLLTFKNLTVLSIGSNVSGDMYKEAIHECFVELRKLREEICSESELERVKNFMIGDIQRQLDGPFTTADTFKGLLFHGLELKSLEDFFIDLNQITASDISDMAQKYLKEEDFLVVTVGPEITG